MKTKSLVLTCALLAATSTAVLAQTTNDTTTSPSTTEPSATQPAPGTDSSTTGTTTMPSATQSEPGTDSGATGTTTTTDPSVTAPSTTEQTAASGSFYQLQQGDMRASRLIGMTVYNDANENIGDINEIVLRPDGKVAAVVIGVGGFLGLGERDVAVPFEQIKMTADGDNTRLTSTLSRDSLSTAPAWSWTVQQ